MTATSRTPDLDKAIQMLQEWLDDGKLAKKEKLAMMDRLTRMLALKYKHNVQGKGGKFAVAGEK